MNKWVSKCFCKVDVVNSSLLLLPCAEYLRRLLELTKNTCRLIGQSLPAYGAYYKYCISSSLVFPCRSCLDLDAFLQPVIPSQENPWSLAHLWVFESWISSIKAAGLQQGWNWMLCTHTHLLFHPVSPFTTHPTLTWTTALTAFGTWGHMTSNISFIVFQPLPHFVLAPHLECKALVRRKHEQQDRLGDTSHFPTLPLHAQFTKEEKSSSFTTFGPLHWVKDLGRIEKCCLLSPGLMRASTIRPLAGIWNVSLLFKTTEDSHLRRLRGDWSQESSPHLAICWEKR